MAASVDEELLPVASGDLWLLCGPLDHFTALSDSDPSVTNIDDLLSDIDVSEVDKQMFTIAQSWYRCKGRDLTSYDGVSLGTIFEHAIRGQPILSCLKLLRGLHNLYIALEKGATRKRLIVVDSQSMWETSLLQNSVHGTSDVIVVKYGRILIDTQLSALELFSCVYHMEFVVRTSTVYNAFASGSSTFFPPAPRFNWRRKAAYWLFNTVSSAFSYLDPKAGKANKPVVFISTYNVTNRLVARWSTQSNPSFRLIVLRPFSWKSLPLLAVRGAHIARTQPLSSINGADVLTSIIYRWREAVSELDCLEHCQVGRISLAPILLQRFSWMVEHEFPVVAEYLNWWRKYLKRNNVQLVVVPFDTPIEERCIISQAQALGIKTLGVQHGHADPSINPENFLSRNLAVFSSGALSVYERSGTLAARLFITGCAFFDDHYPLVARKRHNMPHHDLSRVLILTTTGGWQSASHREDESRDYLRTVLESLYQANPQAIVTVKLHPSESLSRYQAPEYNPGFATFKYSTGSLKNYLRQNDIIVGPDSTAMYEAILYGLPMIVVNFTKRQYSYPFDGQSGIPVVFSSSELVHEYIHLSTRKDCSEEQLAPSEKIGITGPFDGANTQRLYRVVEDLVAPDAVSVEL